MQDIQIETFGEGVKVRLLEEYGTGDGLSMVLPDDYSDLTETLRNITKEFPTEKIMTTKVEGNGDTTKLSYINGEVGINMN